MSEIEGGKPADKPTPDSCAYWENSIDRTIAQLRQDHSEDPTQSAIAKNSLSYLEYFQARMAQGDIGGYREYVDYVKKTRISDEASEGVTELFSGHQAKDPGKIDSIITAIQQELDNRAPEILAVEALWIKERNAAVARAEAMVLDGVTDRESWIKFVRDEVNRIKSSFPEPHTESFATSFDEQGYRYPRVSAYTPFALQILDNWGRGGFDPQILIEEIAPHEASVPTVKAAQAEKKDTLQKLAANGKHEQASLVGLTVPHEVEYRRRLYEMGQALIGVLKGGAQPDSLESVRVRELYEYADMDMDILPAFASKWSTPELYRLFLGSDIMHSVSNLNLLQEKRNSEANLVEILEKVNDESQKATIDNYKAQIKKDEEAMKSLTRQLSQQRKLMEEMKAGSHEAFITYINGLAEYIRTLITEEDQSCTMLGSDNEWITMKVSDIVAEPNVQEIIKAVVERLQEAPPKE